jgi:hypothetical protein
MCALTTLRTRHLVTLCRRTSTRLPLLVRRDATQVLNATMTIPALARPAPAGMQSR